MTARLFWASLLSALIVSALIVLPVAAKDKDKNKSQIPEYVLRAQTVRVVVDPGAGEPLDQPSANSTARDSVEKALTEWGRFRVVMDGAESELIITVHTGDGRAGRPTIQGGPIDQRPGVAQGTDSTIRVGAQQGRPPFDDPSASPYGQARVGTEIGPSEDTFAVYRGGIEHPLDAPAVWRYSAKDCLREPDVAAVEKFRKVLADAEKPKSSPQSQPQPQTPQQNP
jgi:hypothetical protein